jgi:hypothetical protein
MKVYYKQGWGIFFVVFGIVLVALNIMLINMGVGRGFQVVFCLFITLIGVLYLNKPYFELRSNEIVLFNLFGMELKNYHFENISQLQVLDDKVYLNIDGKSKKIRVSKFMSRTADWEAFIHLITGGDLTNELHNI